MVVFKKFPKFDFSPKTMKYNGYHEIRQEKLNIFNFIIQKTPFRIEGRNQPVFLFPAPFFDFFFPFDGVFNKNKNSLSSRGGTTERYFPKKLPVISKEVRLRDPPGERFAPGGYLVASLSSI